MSLQIAGRLDLAEQMYRAILQTEPKHATANHCIGMLHVQQQRPTEGLSYLMAALETSPAVPDYWLGFLEALLLAGRTEEASQTLTLARQHGLAGGATDDFERRLLLRLRAASAITAESAITATSPIAPTPANSLSRATPAVRRQEAALQRALRVGRLQEAETRARNLIKRFPGRGLGFKTLGALLWARGCLKEAVEAMQISVVLLPQDAEAHVNLGVTLNNLERYEEAETCLRRALQLDPNIAPAYTYLSDACHALGRYAEAEASLRKGMSVGSDSNEHEKEVRHANLLFLMGHNPELDAQSLFAEHCRFGASLESPLRAFWPRHSNARDPDRRLRLGFVSADFYNHAITSFIEPLLSLVTHRSDLELHAYCNNLKEDDVTQRLRGYMHHWNSVTGLPDPKMARKIMDDRIDILLDLSGVTSSNRLSVFARKPAPIQISWMGYPGTTGLRAMDYYLADRHFLPPGEFDRYFTEKLVYLPSSAPFRPERAAPPIAPLPALHKGHVTFGSFNRMGKMNPAAIGLWSQLLRTLPDSLMLIGNTPPASRQSLRLIEWFTAEGVAPDRLRFHPRCSIGTYLALHHEVDLCLDTIPYSGGTTTYHALWMGVPTLTVAGPTPASRQGAAIFEHLDLQGFIAADARDFLTKGLYWAHQLPALATVRAGLRERALKSAVCDPRLIAGAFIRALRHMWIRWCNGLPAESFEIDAAESIGAVHGRS
jgi:predicted O-linked N-acetylglucosamine transferase (SPINDLY family)